ncbi:serine hydrolase domain-containing protein [Sphingobium lignivorans]|uniref:CubicO group peptidase (Beta-lactamase class C family) n=1 Tax=Sphingobium lignivorans TaxID=2735886 RepID=A0ABR6NAG4_9SPHN|nr:serine hydrolase [Sphingobium lignivorans]MBB5984271.1 CubicO group peptidase (beta-lactamase class C family) [Sphingobium lignivorans]
MKIKMLCRWSALLGASLLLAGASASQDVPARRYAVLADSPGVSAAALREAIDPLFDAASGESVGETRALIVMRDGEVIAERYAEGFGPDSRFLSWSIAKTVTGLIAGIMVSDGRLALDDPAPVPAWRQAGDPRAAITLRMLLQMRSGLLNRELWTPARHSDPLDMLVGEGAADQAAFAAAKPLVDPDGRTFNYSSATSMILTGIMTDQLAGATRDPRARRDAMARFLAARFSGPLGLTGFSPEYDESGTLDGSVMMHMTARDYARIGEFIRHRGHLDGRQLIADRWFDFMLAPSPANAAYGGHIWLNRAGEQAALFPGQATQRLVAGVGNRGQYLLVSPGQGLTIVRLGVTREEDMDALRDALARLVRRFPD